MLLLARTDGCERVYARVVLVSQKHVSQTVIESIYLLAPSTRWLKLEVCGCVSSPCSSAGRSLRFVRSFFVCSFARSVARTRRSCLLRSLRCVHSVGPIRLVPSFVLSRTPRSVRLFVASQCRFEVGPSERRIARTANVARASRARTR